MRFLASLGIDRKKVRLAVKRTVSSELIVKRVDKLIVQITKRNFGTASFEVDSFGLVCF